MKKTTFLLLFIITCSNAVIAQIKPLKFALQSKLNVLDFPENKRVILTKLHDKLLKAASNQMDSVAKTKSKCMNYVGIDTKKADIICLIDFYKDNFNGYANIPMIKYSWIDGFTKDTLKESSHWGTALKKMPKTISSDYELLEDDFAYIIAEFLYATEIILICNLASCENVLDYKQQKLHKKAVVFVAYPTIMSGKKDKKMLQLINNIISNMLIGTQIAEEKLKHIDRRFIFYPYNKETKDIKPDITIQLQLVQDKTGNYELKGEFTGKDVNFKGPGGNEMKQSIIFNKKRIDSGDYTELVYKLSSFMNNVYVYNVHF